MSKWENLLERILSGQSDTNIRFVDMCSLLGQLGYIEDTSGSYLVFQIFGRPEIISMQPLRDGKMKVCQACQSRAIFQQYGITQMSHMRATGRCGIITSEY